MHSVMGRDFVISLLHFFNTRSLLNPIPLTSKKLRGKSGKERYVTCRPVGKFFMFIVATLPSTLILYL
jgi:hypothetical protein